MQNQLSSDANKLMVYFRDHALIAGDFVVAGQIRQIIPGVSDLMMAIDELVRAGWLMVPRSSAGPVPSIALTDFGHQMLYQPGSK